jgi:hypothetical protein
MAVEVPSGDHARTRLRQSRAHIYQLVRELQGYRPPPEPEFPRSRLMRSLLGNHRGSSWLAGAGIALTLMRPRLIWRMAQWVLASPLAQRVLIPWLIRQAAAARRR